MYNAIQSKQHDYDYIIRTIDSMSHLDHAKAISTMIELFNKKWKPKNGNDNIVETIELQGVLKYKIKKLSQTDNF